MRRFRFRSSFALLLILALAACASDDPVTRAPDQSQARIEVTAPTQPPAQGEAPVQAQVPDAAPASAPTPGDPLESTNRRMLDFNMAVDDAAIRPVAEGYRDVVPSYGRRRIRAVLDNFQEPRVLINQLLQGRPLGAAETMFRFLFNSTIGLAGLYDVSTDWGLPAHRGDLGQTLYVWGIGDGPYLMLPLAGPSNTRDTVGWIGDGFMNPFNWLMPPAASAARGVVDGIDLREQNIEGLDELRYGSLDFYARLRSVWQQRRDAELGRSAATEGGVPDVLEDPGAAPAGLGASGNAAWEPELTTPPDPGVGTRP